MRFTRDGEATFFELRNAETAREQLLRLEVGGSELPVTN